MSATLFSSNRFEVLAELLYQNIYSSLGRKIVIAPSDQIKKFVQNYCLERAGVAFGLQFLRIDEALKYLLDLNGFHVKFPSAGELFLDLAGVLKDEGGSFPEIVSYLKREKSLRDLADQLSRLFLRYGKEESASLLKWSKSGDWQSRLYQKLFSAWQSPASFFLDWSPQKSDIPVDIHLFGTCPLKPLQIAYFKKFSQVWPVTFYSLAPSRHYLGDIVPEKEIETAQEGHLIVRNFGQYGARVQKTWLDLQIESQDLFIENQAAKTQLEWLQNEILDFKPAGRYAADDSIQLHEAPSKLREIEILKMVVLNLLNEESDLTPQDFLIMAPDIASYLPHIQLVFSQSELAYEVSDLPLIDQNSPLKALAHFLDMIGGPFNRASVLQFFSFDCVVQKRGLVLHEEFEQWLEKASVRFGLNGATRRDYLLTYAGPSANPKENEVGTFAHGLFHLMMGLVMGPQDESPYFPSAILEFSQADALGLWISAIESLHQFIAQMEHSKRQIGDWIDLLIQFCAAFIEGGEEALTPLLREFRGLPERSAHKDYPFETIKMVLKRSLARSQGRIASADRLALSFASLKAGRAVPAKVIYLLGLENFPHHERELSFNSFKSSTHTMAEEDRMLFLELITCARRHFIMSYVYLSAEDGKRQPPSLYVDELKRALHGELLSYEHPAYRFHPSYFSPDARWKNFSPDDFAAEGKRRSERGLFVALPAPQSDGMIRLKSLENLAKNPLKFFLNEALGIYFPFEKESASSEFILPPYEIARLKREAIEGKLSLEREARLGHLPQGIFQRVVWDDLQELINEERGFSIVFKQGCEKVYHSHDNQIIFPPLHIASHTLIGELPPVNSRGLLVRGKRSPEERLKIWPLFLCYLHLPLAELALPPQIAYIDGEELYSEEIKKELVPYLSYYQRALQVPSPLHPMLYRDFFKGADKFAHKVASENEIYLSWLEGAQFDLTSLKYYDYWKESDVLQSLSSYFV